MNQAVDFVFSASGMLAAFAAGVLWMTRRPGSRAARAFLILSCLAYLAAGTYAVAYAATALVAAGYHPIQPADVPPGKVAVVALGAGDVPAFGWTDVLYLPSPVAAARVLETARAYRLLNPDWVISSGGNLSPTDPSEPSAKNMRDLLVRLGVPLAKIRLEAASRTTRDEAIEIAAMLRSLGADHVVLVTSAVHMRRSVGAFRAAGVDPVPAVATDPFYRLGWSDWIIPGNRGLDLSAQVVHELAGIAYYRIRGWWR